MPKGFSKTPRETRKKRQKSHLGQKKSKNAYSFPVGKLNPAKLIDVRKKISESNISKLLFWKASKIN